MDCRSGWHWPAVLGVVLMVIVVVCDATVDESATEIRRRAERRRYESSVERVVDDVESVGGIDDIESVGGGKSARVEEGYDGGYRIGVGRGDCTGPPVEVTFMGYAHMKQRGHGLHLRQYARAFIVEQTTVSDDNRRPGRLTFVSVDAAMMSHSVKRDVLAKLQRTFNGRDDVGLFTADNTIISGTHTHGTPGGYMQDVLYDMTSFGFVAETHFALVDGIYRSIVQAHGRMRPGRIYVGHTEVLDASINRSPSAYLENPAAERARYAHDTDKQLTQLRFVATAGDRLMGAINWYAVHPTSMNRTNCLITSDNVGYASLLLEKEFNRGSLAGRGDFVGAFAATNLGDVSPNINGPKCQLTGRPCDLYTSSCPDNHGMCIASGPGADIFESTQIIAGRLFAGAMSILKSPTTGSREVRGPIRSAHQFIDMPTAQAVYTIPETGRRVNVGGCWPAMGYSFAAGTTDGPGAFDFTQGTVSDNPLWNVVRDFLSAPTADDVRCQSPKPILLATGRATFPYSWQPRIVATQMAQLGDVYLAAVPGEFTTMSGRRLRATLRQAIAEVTSSSAVKESDVIVVGLANMYTSYVATPEEYRVQRYEGASTVYGPHTLTVYLDQYERLARAMLAERDVAPGPQPPRLDDKLLSFQTGVVMDTAPGRRHFGDVIEQPAEVYYRNGGGTRERRAVRVVFVAGNPRNDLQHERTYLAVERLQPDGRWLVVLTDADWDTWFVWRRTSFLLGQSEVEVYWDIAGVTPTEPGTYRIRHFGAYKRLFGAVFSYVGASRVFNVK